MSECPHKYKKKYERKKKHDYTILRPIKVMRISTQLIDAQGQVKKKSNKINYVLIFKRNKVLRPSFRNNN